MAQLLPNAEGVATTPPGGVPLVEDGTYYLAVAAEGNYDPLHPVDGDDDGGSFSLEPCAVEDLNEMEKPALPASMDILVQFDRIAEHSAANVPASDTTGGDWTDTRRGMIVHDSSTSAVSTAFTRVVPSGSSELNMGRTETLVNFVNWAKATRPASRYALVLWDHGGGWTDCANGDTDDVVDSILQDVQDVDFFRFSAAAGQVLHATVCGDGIQQEDPGLAPLLTVYAPDGEMVLARAEGNVDGLAECGPVALPVAGDYYLAVTSVGNSDPLHPAAGETYGRYTLNLLYGDAEDVNPRLDVGAGVVDFGDVEVGSLNQAAMRLTNTGGR